MILAVYRSRFANTLTQLHAHIYAGTLIYARAYIRESECGTSQNKKNLNINESTSKKIILQEQQQRKIHNEPGSIYLHLTFIKFKCGY